MAVSNMLLLCQALEVKPENPDAYDSSSSSSSDSESSPEKDISDGEVVGVEIPTGAVSAAAEKIVAPAPDSQPLFQDEQSSSSGVAAPAPGPTSSPAAAPKAKVKAQGAWLGSSVGLGHRICLNQPLHHVDLHGYVKYYETIYKHVHICV